MNVKMARALGWTESKEELVHSMEVASLEEGSCCPHGKARQRVPKRYQSRRWHPWAGTGGVSLGLSVQEEVKIGQQMAYSLS
jgi:hypothetical protein